MDVLDRVQYAKPPVLDRQADLLSQFGELLQYWSWQFGRDWGSAAGAAAALFADARARRTLGTDPARQACRPGRARACSVTLTAGAGLLPELQVRLLDAPRAPRSSPARGARARLLLHRLLRLLRGAGRRWDSAALIRGIADSLGGAHPGRQALARWRSPVLLVALIPLSRQPRHGHPGPRDAGARLRRRHARVRRAVRHPDHRRRQRHLPALVRAGSARCAAAT